MQKGIGVSSGIAIGKALVYKSSAIDLTHRMIAVGQVEQQKQRIQAAVVATQRDLSRILEAQPTDDELIRDLIEVQLEIAEDPALVGAASQYVEISLNDAGDALLRAAEDLAAQFEKLESEYLRARAADVRDVGNRLAANALGQDVVDLSLLGEPVVVFARDLSPSETATMDKKNVLGLVTEAGSVTSHAAIIAKALGVPAIMGIREGSARAGQLVALDGTTGELIVDPSVAELEAFQKRLARFEEDAKRLAQLKDLPATTIDGVSVELAVNIAGAADASQVREVGASGVGLFRTEFLYMDACEEPSENQQFAVYRAVAEQAQGSPVIIRTLDAGGDKEIGYLKVAPEDNPFLGYRAIRICLDRPALFKTQLRSMLRASAFGKLRIMFPMICSLSELLRSRVLVDECKQELIGEGISFDPDIEIGMMVETPAVAAAAELFAPHVDFFSIGTNDLCQYALAVDRLNPQIADLYNHFSPGVLRLIRHTIEAAKLAGIRVGMCGEMASSVAAVPVLLGFGLDEFSMSAASVPYVKDRIRRLTHAEAMEITETIMAMNSATAIKRYLEETV